MLTTLINAFKEKEIRKKMLLTLLMLLIFRLGCFIPVPGIASGSFQSLSSNDFFSIMSTITGGSLQNGTLFALGIIPFINAFIIMQLLTLIIPPLDRLSKQGEDGRKKITQITRYMAILLAVIQGVGICLGWGKGMFDETFGSTSLSMALVIIMFVGGSCLVMWLADRITEYGIGNGTSLIIFVGILASAGQALLSAFTKVGDGDVAKNVWLIIAFLVVVLFVFVFIIFVDLAERKIAVKYSQQVKGRKLYGGQTTYIPMKVNAGGVMPIIFASSFLMFPQMIASFWPQSAFYQWWAKWLGIGTPIYIAVMCLLILFFSFFRSFPVCLRKAVYKGGEYWSTSAFSDMKEFIDAGIADETFLWNPIELGYASSYAAVAMVKGDFTGAAGEKVECGELGELEVTESDDGGSILFLNKLNSFTKDTVNDWVDIL